MKLEICFRGRHDEMNNVDNTTYKYVCTCRLHPRTKLISLYLLTQLSLIRFLSSSTIVNLRDVSENSSFIKNVNSSIDRDIRPSLEIVNRDEKST